MTEGSTQQLTPRRIRARCSRCFFFSSRRRHTRCSRDWSSDVCSSDLSHIERDPGLLERELLDRGRSTDRPQYAVERAETPSVARLKLELAAPGTGERQIGRASCRERV